MLLYATVPGFYAEVERAANPGIEGRPVIVGGDPRKRGLVQSATPDALAAGVEVGMPMREALERCPQGRALRTDMRRYRELFKFLIAFLIYNDGIGTIIGVAAIYGAELGFGDIDLILAILLVQFVGIPFSLIFGRLPSQADKRRPMYLAFIIFNVIVLPLVGIIGARSLEAEKTGAPLPAYETTTTAVGEGTFLQRDRFGGPRCVV